MAWHGGPTIGALVTIAALAADPVIAGRLPGLAAAADGLATPQIRRVATVGGNLLQRNRCWYFRHPATSCLKKGGDRLPGPVRATTVTACCSTSGRCVAPHPSRWRGAAGVRGQVATDRRADRPVGEVFGDGSGRAHDHRLGPTSC